jgi:hypothetical protein
LAAAFDFARLACGDWERERFWNWKGRAEGEIGLDLDAEPGSDAELVLAIDVGVVKKGEDVFGPEVAFNVLTGVGGGMRFTFRDVRNGEGVCGA